LGILEELRAKSAKLWTNSSELHSQVDKLLRELANPNLHDLTSDMPYRIELWDRYAQHIRWVVAAAGTITVGHAAFDAAIAAYPNEHFTLRNRALLIREHPPKGR
jgi:hypothetical protein